MVNEENLVLAVLLDNLKTNYKDFVKDYKYRISLQWKIYLLEQLGFKLCNNFSWGKLGVYSYDLMEKLYDCLINIEPTDLDGYAFNEPYQGYFDKFIAMENEKPDMIDNYKWLHLLSSVCFWKEKNDNWKDSVNQLLQPDILTHQELADVCLTKHIKQKREVK